MTWSTDAAVLIQRLMALRHVTHLETDTQRGHDYWQKVCAGYVKHVKALMEQRKRRRRGDDEKEE